MPGGRRAADRRTRAASNRSATRPRRGREPGQKHGPRTRSKAGKMAAEGEVSERGGDVEQEVRDDEGPRPSRPEEDHAEQRAHREVPREASPTLIQVIG